MALLEGYFRWVSIAICFVSGIIKKSQINDLANGEDIKFALKTGVEEIANLLQE